MIILIMAGGNGSRLWPLSRKNNPKQLLPLLNGGTQSLLQATVERIKPLADPEDIFLVLSNDFQLQAVNEQLPELLPKNILVEPEGKNTTAAVAFGAATLAARGRDQEIMTVLSADHVIDDSQNLLAALRLGEQFLTTHPERLLTIGVTPTYPETGYGYIERGEVIEPSVFAVRSYREKPARDLATQYVEDGQHLWNTGMFMWRVATILERISRYSPKHQPIISAVLRNNDLLAAYHEVPNVAIDYSVSERDPELAVIETTMTWRDIGHWQAFKAYAQQDSKLQSTSHVTIDSENCLVRSTTNRIVATIGLKNFVIIDTPDAILICHENDAQRVRDVTDQLKKNATLASLL